MITKHCIETVLPVVADSWEKLRGCDVYRLLTSTHYDSAASLEQACQIIYDERPDLRDEIGDSAVEIAGELYTHKEPIRLIRHILGAEVWQDQDGVEWYRKPDGELVFNVRLYPRKVA